MLKNGSVIMRKLIVVFCLLVILILSGCNETKINDSIVESLGTQDELVLKNRIGKIKIVQSESDKIAVNTIKKAKSDDNDKEKEIIDNIGIRVDKDGNKIIIKEYLKSDAQKNLWEWIQKEYGSVNVSIEYNVEIPNKFRLINISSDIGDIEVQNLKGEFAVSNNIGDITLNDVDINGNSNILSNLGSVSVNAQKIDGAKEINITSRVGDVDLNVPENSKYNLIEPSISQHANNQKERIPNIKLKANVGSIKLNGKKY